MSIGTASTLELGMLVVNAYLDARYRCWPNSTGCSFSSNATRSMVSSAAPRGSSSTRASVAEAFLADIRWVAEPSLMPEARSSSYSPCSASISLRRCTSAAGRKLCMSAIGSPSASLIRSRQITSARSGSFSARATFSLACPTSFLITWVVGARPAAARSSYRLVSSTSRSIRSLATSVPAPRLRVTMPLLARYPNAARTVGLDSPSRSASSTSLSSRAPARSVPDLIAFSKCWASWKYSGTGLARSMEMTSGPVVRGFCSSSAQLLCRCHKGHCHR